MSGLAEVARSAGVSKATASRALSGGGYVAPATRHRVAEAAAALGYVPSTTAQGLATGRTRSVAVVMPYVDRWFFAGVLEGIQSALLERGLDLLLYTARPGTPARHRVLAEFLARKRFDGLIAVGLEPESGEQERMLSLGKPLVSVIADGTATSGVTLDDADAGQRATAHLIGLGHRSIVFLGAGVHTNWPHVESARVLGYLEAMRAAGLGDRARHTRCELTLPAGYAAAVDLLSEQRDRPTGIVAACDEVAIGAIVAARRLGIQVPSRLSVIGIDDHEYAEMFSLTTLHQSPRDQGAQAVAMLVDRIQDPTLPAEQVRLKPRLVVRNSTGPVNLAASAIVADSGFVPRSDDG